MLGLAAELGYVVIGISALLIVGFFSLVVKCYRKVLQGQALIRNGVGGTRVSFSGMFVIPIFHRCEYMDVSVKRIEIDRRAIQGLICKDNLRADIVVALSYVSITPRRTYAKSPSPWDVSGPRIDRP